MLCVGWMVTTGSLQKRSSDMVSSLIEVRIAWSRKRSARQEPRALSAGCFGHGLSPSLIAPPRTRLPDDDDEDQRDVDDHADARLRPVDPAEQQRCGRRGQRAEGPPRRAFVCGPGHEREVDDQQQPERPHHLGADVSHVEATSQDGRLRREISRSTSTDRRTRADGRAHRSGGGALRRSSCQRASTAELQTASPTCPGAGTITAVFHQS